MNNRLSIVIVSAIVLLSGCAAPPQLPLPITAQAFAPAANKYGVAMTAIPAADTYFPGANCLLCIAAASVANSSLTTHTRTLTTTDLSNLNQQAADALRKKGAQVTLIDNLDLKTLPDNSKAAPNFARKDFTGLKAKYKVDKLLVIAVDMTGFERTYAAYIPAGDPKAKVAGASYIVNLNDNSLEWYKPIQVVKAAHGAWDEPPKFPGLTNAYFQAIELTRDEVLTPLAQ